MKKKWYSGIHENFLFVADRFPFVMVLLLFLAFWIFLAVFNTTLEQTNTEKFCISCHEMYENVYQEYRTSVHASNNAGIRASCPDCHVPKQWFYKLLRKINASNELYHHFAGSIDTPEKFRSNRLQLAENVWQTMSESNSHECRNCHSIDNMNLTTQKKKSSIFHEYALKNKKTCIDCHKGIVHRLPDGYKDEAYEKELEAMHKVFEQEKVKCFICHENMAHSDW